MNINNYMDSVNDEHLAETILRTMRYCRLYKLAHGYAPSQQALANSLAAYFDLGLDPIDNLELVVDETLYLAEECHHGKVPGWMAAGAPDRATHTRWVAQAQRN